MRPRLLFYVQHLLGIGHLVRAGRIASALAARFDLRLVVGGEVPPGLLPSEVETVRLPPVRAGAAGFSALVHPDGRPFGAEDQAARRDLLLGIFAQLSPDVLLIEAFPFGRRPMRFELLPLLDAAQARVPRPLVVASIRDILQETRPERQAETVALVARTFDLVLVHGDRALVPLDATFPMAARFATKIRYTGMVGPVLHPGAPVGEHFDVIVSAGGGAVGAGLIATALLARPVGALRDARWLVLAGPNAGGTLRPRESPGLAIRAFVSDLPARLAQARLSVSQAGYNTVADLAAARCRAVLVPFARGGETEQSRRAALLATRGWAVAVPEAALDAERLARAMEEALALPLAGPQLGLEGAERTCAILIEALGLPGAVEPA